MKVAIIGGLHHNTLGVVRSLGEKKIGKENIDVLIICKSHDKKNIISESKYVSNNHITYINNTDGVLPWLLSLAKDGNHRTIVCCSDAAAEIVIANNAKLSQSYKMPELSIDVHEFMSKKRQDEVAISCGLAVPHSIFVSKGEQFDWEYYPCITKPLKSAMGAGKDDIIIAQNKQELIAAIEKISSPQIVIQQYIDKSEEFQLIGCSLDAGEKMIIPGFTKMLRQPPNTNTGYLVYSPIEQLQFDVGKVHRFIKEIGYSGLFSVEFIRDKSGDDYFLEINMRNDGNAYCVKSAGVNLPYIWCFDQEYGKLPDDPVSFNKPIHFIPDFYDFSLGKKEVGLKKWIGEFFRAESHSIYNTKDMKPFYVALIHNLKKRL